MHASFLYLQYFLEKFYEEINDNTDFFKIHEFFLKLNAIFTRGEEIY